MRTEKRDAPSTGEPEVCPECRGRGWLEDNLCVTEAKAHRCNVCDGKGVTADGRECFSCHGTGLIETRFEDKVPCPRCRGAGVYPVPESMTSAKFAFNPAAKRKDISANP